MPYSDSTLTCTSCGVAFLDTAWAQRERARQDPAAPPPRRCPGCRALERLTRRRRGVVRWFSARQGYGFIRDEQGADVFVHRTALAPTSGVRLRAGMAVEYEVRQEERGSVARDVRPAPPAADPTAR
jgi:CspA family cold shock protein